MSLQNFDVIVLGLGGMGSAAAYHIAARGKRVLGLDQYEAAHDRGSSHGESRIIRQAYYENPAYVPLLQRAYELWERLERGSGASLLRLTGGLMIGPPGSAVVQGTIASATEHHLPFEVLDVRELVRRFPVFRPRADDSAVYELRAGFLRPEAAVRAHLELAARSGADLHFGERVESWQATNEAVRVKTTRGEYSADHLVIAPGAWAPELLASIGVKFEIRRHAMCWFRPRAEADLFSPERLPVYIYDVDGRDCFYGFPQTSAADHGIKIAMHSGGAITTPGALDRNVGGGDIEELREHMQRFLPALNGEYIQGAICMYTLTPDEHFVVALHPQHKNVALAAGFSGHGFKFTTVIGEVLADLATEGCTRQPIALFRPERFQV
ncbi:MAG TPA: N-methyl-L-tryptophan oxidase [Bryobacteraceae bacterium]|nr:N-methyl-L-tryptophan oxidase [Bryobacteraceae bacterium]